MWSVGVTWMLCCGCVRVCCGCVLVEVGCGVLCDVGMRAVVGVSSMVVLSGVVEWSVVGVACVVAVGDVVSVELGGCLRGVCKAWVLDVMLLR